MTTNFKVGDIVCHRAGFLRSVGWYTDVPINGRVEAITNEYMGIVQVEWSDGNVGRILSTNLILYSERHLEAN